MTRKGRLKEIFSKALYADDPNLYSVSYREFNSIIKVSLPEFLKLSENFEIIPSCKRRKSSLPQIWYHINNLINFCI
jgi:hypothetical protein